MSVNSDDKTKKEVYTIDEKKTIEGKKKQS